MSIIEIQLTNNNELTKAKPIKRGLSTRSGFAVNITVILAVTFGISLERAWETILQISTVELTPMI